MTRDDLEAEVRRQVARAVSNALMSGTASPGMANRAAEAILVAADEYASARAIVLAEAKLREPEPVTAARRAELGDAVARRNRKGAGNG
jgi:hypothetical protein